MKKIYAVAAAAVFAIAIAACGGGDGATGGGGTTEATAAGTSYQVMSKSFNLMGEVLPQMMGGGVGGQVIKESGVSVTCNEVSDDTWTCNLNDGQGGTATMTGTFLETGAYYVVNFDAAFDDFKPEAGTVIDGSFALAFTINPSALNDLNAGVKNLFGKSTTAKETDFDCSYEDSIDGEGYCEETNTQCTPASADHFFSFEFTIGPEGFTYTDICGTFVYSPNTKMTMEFCSTDPNMGGLFTAAINGTFNGEAVNESYSAICDWSEL